MKSFRSMFRGYAVALLAVLFFTASAQATANKGIIRAIRGGSADVSIDKGKTWKKANVGTVIAANSAIRTDANAQVDVFLGDNGPVVRVTPGSTLGFDKLDVENAGIEKVIDTQLDLKNGRILGNVKKMAAASKYEVKTPVGVAGIRGTEYSISASGEVNVVSGTVVVVYIVNGQPTPPVTIQANQGVAAPPVAANQAATVTSINQSVTPETTTLTVGITTNPNGTTTATLEGAPAPGGQPVTITTSNNGTIPIPTGAGSVVTASVGPSGTTVIITPPTTITTPAPTTQGNPNVIPGDLTQIQPD